MSIEHCYWEFCFVPLNPSAPKFFGFSEYLAALALMVVVWTTADIRYRFRIATAPLPLYRLTYGSLALVGVLALLTDLWRAEGWLVPQGNILTPATWQALLGALFLSNFLIWAWFAYLIPSAFGKRNAKRIGSYVYEMIVDSSPTEMSTIANELIRSVPALISNAPNIRRLGGYLPDEKPPEPTLIQSYANEILLLIADRRFCRTLVDSAPGLIQEIFKEIDETGKHGVSVSQFGRNVVTAAIENHNSFIYHEAEGYDSGLLGYVKPLSQAIFGNHGMAEVIDSLLDPNYKAMRSWTVVEWEAYNRAVLITMRSYVATQSWQHSFILCRALDRIGRAASDIHKINGSDGSNWNHDTVQRLQASVEFCRNAIEILNEHEPHEELHLRIRKGDPFHYSTLYDHLAELIFELILAASAIKRPWDLCWAIQHNTVWGGFFDRLGDEGSAGKIVKFKLRRKLYDEIITSTDWPNFKNVKVLGFCLNVMGLTIHEGSFGRDSRPLQKAVLAWTRRNFAALEEKSPQVFEDCLPNGLSYDKECCRLVKTYPVNATRSQPEHLYFDLERPTAF